ncbi:MAG: 2Fe-2S iron-sulfur cluster-binding protein, partial [bacterium]
METVLIKVKRQDDPEDLPYWELFEVELSPGMTVAQALAMVRENPVTADGNSTSPVAHDCSCMEGLCGACAMQINGKARLACATFVEEFDGPIMLEPLSKFPLTRDLRVDRTRILEALS